jgi:hypothetical protein
MIKQKIAFITMLAGLAGGSLQASDTLTNFITGDLLICFQGANANRNFVVDAGPISTYAGYSVNTSHAISAYTASQISYVGFDGASWSAFAWGSDNTLYMTSPRTTLGVQAAAWIPAGSVSQNNVILRMTTIPPGAVDNLNAGYGGGNSTVTAAVEPQKSSGNANYKNGVSYHDAIDGGYGSDWNGLFQGNPENTIDPNGTGNPSDLISQSDLYQLTPGAANATWLGYFETQTDGTMVFVAKPSTPAVIQSITRSGNSVTITYTAGIYGTYTLRSHNNLSDGVPQISWASVQTLTSGDTAIHSVTFTDSATTEFYTITAQ